MGDFSFNFSLLYADSLRFSCKLNLHGPSFSLEWKDGSCRAAPIHYHPLDSSVLVSVPCAGAGEVTVDPPGREWAIRSFRWPVTQVACVGMGCLLRELQIREAVREGCGVKCTPFCPEMREGWRRAENLGFLCIYFLTGASDSTSNTHSSSLTNEHHGCLGALNPQIKWLSTKRHATE